MTWTFATDGNIYAKPETDLTLVVADPNGDGYAVIQSVTDGTTELSRTSLEDGQFSIYTNLDGAGEEWRFNGNTLQVTNNSTVRGFDSNVVVQAMFAGTSGTASLQSVSNQNDPNIFTTIDATTTGANISVYNGGSNGGVEYTWQFGDDGNLTAPGNLVIAGNTNVFGTDSALIQPTDDKPLLAISSGANGAVSSVWVEDIGNVGTSNIAAVYANPTVGSGIVRIAVGQNGSNTGPNLWDFDATGNLTLPTNGHIIVSGGIVGSGASPAPYISGFDSIGALEFTNGNSNVTITANASSWTFDTTGNLNTPGDIVGPAGANLTIYANAGVHEFIFADDGTFYAPDNVVLGGNSIYIGPGANTLTGIEHEVLLASSNNFAYVQGVINNISDNGSAEWVALGAKGDDSGGWGEIGFTSSGFGDANYTITGAGDGYVFAQAYAPGSLAPSVGGGNLVLATGQQGTTKDIIFGTGGFLTANIFGKISNSNNSFELTRTGATITFPDSTIQSTAYTGETSFSIQNSNFSANAGGRYGVNTTSGAVTATLPASPATGVAIFFADAGGAYATNNLIINPNGQTIMGASGNMNVSTANQSFGLFYNGTTWRTYN